MVHRHSHILGTPPCASSNYDHEQRKTNLKSFCKIYIATIVRWCRVKKQHNPSSSSSPSPLFTSSPSPSPSPSPPPLKSHFSGFVEPLEPKSHVRHESSAELGEYEEEEEKMKGDHYTSHRGFYKQKSGEHHFTQVPSLSRNGSRKIPFPSQSFLHTSMSRGSMDSSFGFAPSLSRTSSRRNTTSIMFSNSPGMLKPPPAIRNLECNLEDLCHGCKKKVKITRDVVTNTGHIIQEEETLIIDIKLGWRKGTKITFEGMGNERPGMYPADVIFVIAEKRHPLFRIEGDDLEIAVELPLVKALTGCQISIPLLGGGSTTLMVDDIIHPGFEKIIKGQGMPSSKEQGKRGNLKVVFLVEFPTELTKEQRDGVISILEDSC